MNDFSKSNGIVTKASKDEAATKQPNAVERSDVPLLIRKKRHLSGLMCPPASTLPDDKDNSLLPG